MILASTMGYQNISIRSRLCICLVAFNLGYRAIASQPSPAQQPSRPAWDSIRDTSRSQKKMKPIYEDTQLLWKRCPQKTRIAKVGFEMFRFQVHELRLTVTHGSAEMFFGSVTWQKRASGYWAEATSDLLGSDTLVSSRAQNVQSQTMWTSFCVQNACLIFPTMPRLSCLATLRHCEGAPTLHEGFWQFEQHSRKEVRWRIRRSTSIWINAYVNSYT